MPKLLEGAVMLKLILSAALVTALSSAAFAQSVGERTGVNSALGIAPKTEDFLKEAATSDMLEVDAAKIAQQKGNADEKQFTQQMVTDDTKTSNELRGMVPADMKSALPTSLDGSSQKQLDKRRDIAGQYDPMQVSAHKDAVSLFERYAKGGEDPKLKDWAGKTLPPFNTTLRWRRPSIKTANETRQKAARKCGFCFLA